jgi:type II secretory pathway component GspD/PulD (secretin)
MVSNPKIIVANEEKANIAIVRKEPNIKQERQQTASGQGGAAIDNIVYSLDPDMPFFEYGIKLDVTPSINTSSNITVKINPALTRFVENKQAGDNTYPIYDEKSIETVFNLSSGQTAAIGGLTEVRDSQLERKVPLLGSIPFLGRLFSWEQTISDTRETIIFVTVSLANTQEIDLETGLPEDSELARRRIIRDKSKKMLREHGRKYYRSEEDDKANDMIRSLDQHESKRLEQRVKALEKELEKSRKNEVASS